MTIPKRTNEIIEEQLAAKQAGGLASDLGDATAGLAAADAAQGFADPVTDAATVATGAGELAADAAPEIASGAEDVASGVEDAGKSLWGKLKGLVTSDPAKSVGTLGLETNGLQTLGKDVGSILGEGSSPYEGAGASTGGYRAGPMLTSSKKNAANNIEMEILDQVKDIPKLLEMILENLCNCGQPTPGKFNGMPHCTPGSGCANNVAFSPSNPTGDHCCSCGNPNCSGSFHGQPICAPGQGCNDHWDAERGARKVTPSFAAHVADDDDFDEDDLPAQSATTWE